MQAESGTSQLGAAALRLDFVDALRAIAAIAVLVQHAFERSPYAILREITDYSPGVFGVALFFVVSGFVMPFSVRRGLSLVPFFIRRVMRIYPALLLALFLMWLGAWCGLDALHKVLQATPRIWLANLLLVQDFVGVPPILGVTWTLILEFAWYAVFATLWLWRADRGIALASMLTPVAFMGLTVGSYLVGVRLPLGRIGMIYAALLGARASLAYSGKVPMRRFAFDAVLFLSVMAIGNWVAFGHFHHPKISLMQALLPWLTAPMLFWGVMVMSYHSRGGWWISRIAPIGAVSYSIYLLHPFSITLAEALVREPYVLVTATALTMGLSLIVFRLVEQPGIALGQKLAARFLRSADMAPAKVVA